MEADRIREREEIATKKIGVGIWEASTKDARVLRNRRFRSTERSYVETHRVGKRSKKERPVLKSTGQEVDEPARFARIALHLGWYVVIPNVRDYCPTGILAYPCEESPISD